MSALAAAEGGRRNLAFLDFNAVHAAPPLEPLAELKARADIAAIVGRYVQLKRRGGALWGCCPFHKDRTPSLKVDPERQRWRCFGCNRGGDILDFLAEAEGLDVGGAIRRLREEAGAPDPSRPNRRRPATIPVPDGPDPEAEVRRELARETWRQTVDIWPGLGLPWLYLREVRGIRRWSHDRLRWHGACPWGEGTAGCIVAPVNCHETGLVTAIWRIRPVLEGKVRRLGLGSMRGNAARLFHAPGPAVVVAEGVEDALAARELTGLPAWAALSAGNMAALVLPPHLRDVLILADADESGLGLDKARELAARLRAEGRHATVRRPTAAKDANDALRAMRGAA